VGLWVDRTSEGWELSLRHLSKRHSHMTGTVAPL
jgi:hypothetical protein